MTSEILNFYVVEFDLLLEFIEEQAQSSWKLATVLQNLENFYDYGSKHFNKEKNTDFEIFLLFLTDYKSVKLKLYADKKNLSKTEFLKLINKMRYNLVEAAARRGYEVEQAEQAEQASPPASPALMNETTTEPAALEASSAGAVELSKVDALEALEEIKEKIFVLENILKAL